MIGYLRFALKLPSGRREKAGRQDWPTVVILHLSDGYLNAPMCTLFYTFMIEFFHNEYPKERKKQMKESIDLASAEYQTPCSFACKSEVSGIIFLSENPQQIHRFQIKD